MNSALTTACVGVIKSALTTIIGKKTKSLALWPLFYCLSCHYFNRFTRNVHLRWCRRNPTAGNWPTHQLERGNHLHMGEIQVGKFIFCQFLRFLEYNKNASSKHKQLPPRLNREPYQQHKTQIFNHLVQRTTRLLKLCPA